jgi:hypothetical protein
MYVRYSLEALDGKSRMADLNVDWINPVSIWEKNGSSLKQCLVFLFAQCCRLYHSHISFNSDVACCAFCEFSSSFFQS